MSHGAGVGDRIVINFHGIGVPHDVPEDETPYWCPTALWPAFADALADVRDRGGVPLEITFDDGNLSDVEEALPVLAERGLEATFHVCAGRIGEPRYLGVDAIVALRDGGMGIGSHGWNHVDLRQVRGAALQQEADGSAARIADVVGRDVTQFAIPFGSYDRRVLRSLQGYSTVYTSDGMALRDGWLVPRFSYVQGWRPERLMELAERRRSQSQRLRDRARTLVKSLR